MSEVGNKRRRIAVHNSPIHGRGVFALRRIPKGVRIIEYKGKLITDKEADRRYSRMHANSPHTMLFSLDGGLVIDPHAAATRRVGSIIPVRPTARSRRKAIASSSTLVAISAPARNSPTITICRSAKSIRRRRSASMPASAKRDAAAAQCSVRKSKITYSSHFPSQFLDSGSRQLQPDPPQGF